MKQWVNERLKQSPAEPSWHQFLAYLKKHEITAFSLSEMLEEKCAHSEIAILLSDLSCWKKCAVKVSKISQLSQDLLHKADGLLDLFFFFFFLASFAVWKEPRCKVAQFGSLSNFLETCSPSVTAFFIKCVSCMSNRLSHIYSSR